MILYNWISSPLGELLLTSDGDALTGLYLQGQTTSPEEFETWDADDWDEAPQLDVLVQTQVQLHEYFTHQRQEFNLPLKPQGTKFQQQVWQHLLHIPFGTTISYGTLAQRVGKTSLSRAVGAANGKNPISIIIPCHRVIAADGKLTGYAGGIDRKQWLLHHENAKITVRSPLL